LHNLNLKFDIENDLVAFIEEAGDEGFSTKSSKWFVVSAMVMTYKAYQQCKENYSSFVKKINKNPENKR